VRLERRVEIPIALASVAPLAAIASALVIAGFLIALAGVDPFKAYRLIVVSAFGSRLSITETLVRATPLIFTGLAAAVAFRARIWNIGAEGQLYAGALVSATVGNSAVVIFPAPIAITLLILIGAAAGAILLIGPVFLRLQTGADEVVTTLLLNFIVLLFVSMMIEGPLRDPGGLGWPQSVAVDPSVTLPLLVSRSRLHVGFLLAIAVALALWFVQARTVFGLKVRAAGLNPDAARFAGVSLPRSLLVVAGLSGGLAGLAGTIEILGVRGYVTTDMSPGWGYSGIVVAMLGGLHPLGVIASAIFVALVFVGSNGMSRALNIPSYIADVIVSLSLLAMLLSLLFTNYRIRR
jgi:simple sugar transport system permease protein